MIKIEQNRQGSVSILLPNGKSEGAMHIDRRHGGEEHHVIALVELDMQKVRLRILLAR